jgi:hypothetical protein
MRLAYQGEMAARMNSADAEASLRTAIEVLVDAFLADRDANADCFTRAHKLGAEVNKRFGCLWDFDSRDKHFVNKCGILALHKRFGLSPGGATLSVCSICGASDFGCDHVDGEEYEGQRCSWRVSHWNAAEVSVVTIPADPRCYRVQHPVSIAEAEQANGGPLDVGQRPTCNHCALCMGIYGPKDEDLDPSTWPSLPDDD